MSFARWYWGKINAGERVLILFATWIVISLIMAFFIGSIALLYFMTGILMAGVGFLFYQLTAGIRGHFAKYKRQYDEEQEELVRRLSRGR